MTTYKGLFIFFAVGALLISNAVGEDGEITVTLEPTQIGPGQSTAMTIALPPVEGEASESEVRMAIQVVDELLLEGKDYRVLSRDYALEEGRPTWVYRVTAYQPGSITLPPIEFVWGARTYSTERLRLEVQGTRDAADTELRPGFGPIDMPFRFPWWLWKPLVGLILLGIALYLTYKYLPRYLKRPKPAKSVLPPIPELSEEDILLWLKRRLSEIREKLEAGDQNPRLLDELTLVVKRYFAKRTGGTVESWTTEEFRRRLTYDSRARDLFTLFRDCDAYKFMPKKRDPLAFTEESLDKTESVLIKN